MSITIGQYLLARLSEMGVRYLFGVPGDFNLWFMEQTITSGSIEFVGCCNELNASYAADGNSRLAGISALATTYGPGELSTLLARDLNPIIFLLNNDGYTIERLIHGAESSYNDIHPWRYHRFPAVVDARERTVTHCVRNHAELYLALQATGDTARPHLIEIVLPRMDAPAPLIRFAAKVAGLNFPQLLEERVDQESRSSA
jgi:TPP-dependent 2-oxoacid decarboxylase